MTWLQKTLGEISDEVQGIIRTGPFGSQLHEYDYEQYGIPVVMPKDIIEGRVSDRTIARVGTLHAERLTQHKLYAGDIVYGRRGDIGRQAFITKNEQGWLCGTGCLRISFGENRLLDTHFLHYYLRDKDVVQGIANQAIGATLPNLNTSILRSVVINLPPLPIQRRIAAVLSAYDDLIENNERRIALLEAMARNLYREWFVEFRFPGHEHVNIVERDGVSVPEGWERVSLETIATEIRRGVDPTQIDPETPYVGLEHLPRRSITLFEWGTAKDVQSTKLIFKKGEILFGKIRPYFHKVSVAPINGVCSSDTIVITAREEVYFSLILCCVSSDDFIKQATLTSQGTKMPRANWDVLMNYQIAVPSSKILEQFNAFIRDVVEETQNLMFRSRNLRHTRDLLLPRLVSGELDVAGLAVGEIEEL